LWPRPAVLPRPEPMPRPTRRRALLLPADGFIELRRIACSEISLARYRHEVADLVDHAAHRRRIFELDGLADALQAQTAHRCTVILAAGVRALDERHLQFCCVGHSLMPRGFLRWSCRASPRYRRAS